MFKYYASNLGGGGGVRALAYFAYARGGSDYVILERSLRGVGQGGMGFKSFTYFVFLSSYASGEGVENLAKPSLR